MFERQACILRFEMSPLVFLVVLLARAGPAWSGTENTEARAPDLEVSLLTMSPGDTIFTAYGHTAIRVHRVDGLGPDLVYDYGTYDASAPDAGLRFLQGRLPYWLAVSTLERVKIWYGSSFAAITEQVLELDQARAHTLAARLEWNARAENRAYPYHHFRDNCATRPRDILDKTFGGALRRATERVPSHDTYRDLIEQCMRFAHFARWPIFGMLNGQVDLPISRWERMFLPAYVRDELQALEIDVPGRGRQPAVRARRALVGVDLPSARPPPSPWPGILVCLGMLLVAALPLLPRVPARASRICAGSWMVVWGLLAGLYGCLMAMAWVASPYPETKGNWNILLFNPIMLLLVPLGLALAMGRTRWRRWLERLLLLVLLGVLTTAAVDLLDISPQKVLSMSAAVACACLPTLTWLRLTGRRAGAS